MSDVRRILAAEWQAFRRAVLIESRIPPGRLEDYRWAFFGGAAMMFNLLMHKTPSEPGALEAAVKDLLQELEEFTAMVNRKAEAERLASGAGSN